MKSPWPLGLVILMALGPAACDSDSTRPPPTPTLTLTPERLELRAGDIGVLAVQVTGVEDPVVELASSDPTVGVVDSAGRVTALALGSATITARLATDPDISATALVQVLPGPPPDSVAVTISPAALLLAAGESVPLGATVQGIAAQAVRWRSVDTAVAVVSDAGVVTGRAPGVAVVLAFSAAVPEAVGVATVTVLPAAPRVLTIAPPAAALRVGEVLSLSATVGGTADQRVEWVSLDPSVARVDADGTVTAVAHGVTAVRAVSVADPTASGTAAVTVGQVGLRIEPPRATLDPGDTLRLHARVRGVADTTVTWSTGRVSVATVNVNTGLVTALGPGTAIITARSNGDPSVTAAAVIEVTEPPGGGLSIASIQQVDPTTGQRTSISPTGLRGLLEVVANVGAPSGFDGSLRLVLDGAVVATRALDGVGDTAAFLLPSAAFDPATGEPTFVNGPRTLGVWLVDAEDRVHAVTSVPVAFENPDGFALEPTVTGSAAVDPSSARTWRRGTVRIRAIPVIYSRSYVVSRVELGLCRAADGAPLTSRVDATRENGFLVELPEGVEASLSGGGTGGIEEPVRVCVVSAQAGGGGAASTLVLNRRPELWPEAPETLFNLDTRGPRFADAFTLAPGDTAVWLPQTFRFSRSSTGLGGSAALVDEGVGGVSCVFYAGTGFDDLRPVTFASDLPPSDTPSAYVARAVCSDALGNAGSADLTDGAGTPQRFGVRAS